MPTFLLTDDSANEVYLVFWCGHSRDSNGYYNVAASWVPYHIHTTLCDNSPCAELGFTPHNMIVLDTHHGDNNKKSEKNGTLLV